MNSPVLFLIAFLLIGSSFDALTGTEAFIDFDKVDTGCTISCTAYWACMVKSKDCQRPSRCDCSQVAG